MAYAQWVVIVIKNKSKHAVSLERVECSYGKFHANGNKDNEITPITSVKGNRSETISSCGRSDAAAGTEG